MKLKGVFFLAAFLSGSALADTCPDPVSGLNIIGSELAVGDELALTIGGFTIEHTVTEFTMDAANWPKHLTYLINQQVPAQFAEALQVGDFDPNTFEPVDLNQIQLKQSGIPVALRKNGQDFPQALQQVSHFSPLQASGIMNIPYVLKSGGDEKVTTEFFISSSSEFPLQVSMSLREEGTGLVDLPYDEFSEPGTNLAYTGAFSESNSPVWIGATLEPAGSGTVVLNALGATKKFSGEVFIFSDHCIPHSIRVAVTETSEKNGEVTKTTNYLHGGDFIPLTRASL